MAFNFGGVSTDWMAAKHMGCFFRLDEGTLMQAPMNLDGSRDSNECAVDWNGLDSQGDAELLHDVATALEQGKDIGHFRANIPFHKP